MRFGIWISPQWPWEDSLEVARHCEATGWDSLYVADHFMPNGPGPEPLDGDSLECWSVISAIAAAVPRMRLAPLVTSVTYRHPAVLANMAAAVDRISNGRLTLGLGAGWQENEHASYGLQLGTLKERMDRFEEAVEVVTSMLRQPRTTFNGSYFRLTDAPNQPTPVQERLPILIGGGGEKRTLRIAARWADEWNYWSTPDVLAHKVAVLRSHCEDVGRDPSDIAVSTQALLMLSTDESWLADKRSGDRTRPLIVGTPQEVVGIVEEYARAGADELIIPGFNLGPASRTKDTCDLFISEVASHFRS
ncbi:MAG TPA: LLM class F420-dependent oxidoreductase [Acidimicrobiales bacterium]|nr:LLM class F420-dependent oxidoreductase [Acidimicrobiales bacterium]